MLRRLRLKFICVNMGIVSIMLVVIFGLILHSTYQSMERESIRMMQTIAMSPFRFERPDEAPEEIRLPYFILQIGEDGELETIGGGYYDLSDEEFLRDLIDTTFASETQTGILKEYRLRFCRIVTPVNQCLVFADISSEQSTMNSLMKTCALIGGISFLVFLLISLFFAQWAVRPVAKAWEQQRQFVADASHELKTPLTVILANAELLNDQDYDEISKQQSANNILTMSVRMRELVEQLLDLARVDNGGLQATFSNVNFSKVVSDAILPFEPLFFEKGLELNSQVEDGLTVTGSIAHLRQIVDILLDNAQKYASSPSCVTVALCRKSRNYCLFSVANQGSTIPKEDMQNIFKRFYRADKARTMNHSYGLGLAIAANIAKAHRGKIWVESVDGTNTFYVKLPLKNL